MDRQQMNGKQNDSELDQNQQEKSMSPKAHVALTGFIGGVFWSAIAYLAYYFHFTEVGPKVIISSWASDRWANGALGFFITIILCGLASIVISFIYYVILRKVSSLLVTIVFGAITWAIVHLAFVPLFPSMKGIKEMDLNTLITTLCLYVLFGVFIGVSISFDEKERQRKKESKKQSSEVQS